MRKIPYLSIVRFSDSDAGDFLHNQLSNDVLGLSEGEPVFACYCNPKGRVLALMLVCRHDDDYYVVMASSLVQSVIGRLRMYVLRAKVKIEILEQHAVAGIDGEIIANAQQLATIISIPETDQSLLLMDLKTIDDASDDAVNAWKANELQQGIAWLCPETSAQFLPQWLGFDELGAINFRKGCYPGQEIVARTRYLGKVKRHPRLLKIAIENRPQPMETLQITCRGKSYDAVTVDHGCVGDGNTLLFAVTRMDPELTTEQIMYMGQTASVLE